MGLIVMVAGLAVFVGTHLVTTQRGLRAALIARHGLSVYKLGYSILSAIGLALIVYGFARYRATGWINVWYPPTGMRHLALALMLPATIIFVSAYLRGYIWRFMKHPMLVAIKIWALAHLLANGDLGSIILFGSILAWAVFDRITLKSRDDPGGPPIPFGGVRNDVLAVIVGLVVYAALIFAFHPAVIGVSVIGV
ncbi:NnrU family protein [Bradyrhizobium sp. LHD-71]|uniref:NnrU family protein n=1 Tax=Bradyrhizobium sp. LHD-71 TaxID=3072141 RepID=UPI00280EFEBA|nr:NnrU family protein [Bradyrhizobium sp. LHD-71]MDQ8729854.1 NnrU family protein [Bradyrhizobium sp. LHD-71]